MPGATLRYEEESFENLFRRWKKNVEKDGLLQEVRNREYYEKGSIKRKRAKSAAIKRQRRITENQLLMTTKEGRLILKRREREAKKLEETKRQGVN